MVFPVVSTHSTVNAASRGGGSVPSSVPASTLTSLVTRCLLHRTLPAWVRCHSCYLNARCDRTLPGPSSRHRCWVPTNRCRTGGVLCRQCPCPSPVGWPAPARVGSRRRAGWEKRVGSRRWVGWEKRVAFPPGSVWRPAPAGWSRCGFPTQPCCRRDESRRDGCPGRGGPPDSACGAASGC
jgi:hypothetical protein